MLTSFIRSRSSRAFTLIELLVVCAIILIITTFVLFQQSKFNSATLLRSLSYSVALTVRQAQVYGTSVRGFGSPGSPAVFAKGYGVYFSSGSPSQYYLFADAPPGDGARAQDGSEDLPVYNISKGYSIKRFCAIQILGGSAVCSSDITNPISSLTVYIRRPNPDACFASDQAPSVCAPGNAAVYGSAYIQMQSAGNTDTRSIRITREGQITVCPLNVDPATNC